jgi:hypothetical protein
MIDPAGLPLSRRDLWRAAAPSSPMLPTNNEIRMYLIAEKGRTDFARRPEGTRSRHAHRGWLHHRHVRV